MTPSLEIISLVVGATCMYLFLKCLKITFKIYYFNFLKGILHVNIIHKLQKGPYVLEGKTI